MCEENYFKKLIEYQIDQNIEKENIVVNKTKRISAAMGLDYYVDLKTAFEEKVLWNFKGYILQTCPTSFKKDDFYVSITHRCAYSDIDIFSDEYDRVIEQIEEVFGEKEEDVDTR